MQIIKDKRAHLELKAAILIAKKIREYAKTQPFVCIALPGGRSVKGILRYLEYQKVPWRKVHFFLVDEHLIKPDSQETNYDIIKKNLIDYLEANHKLPRENVHPYIYHNLPINQGLKGYRSELKEISDSFDIIVLGVGEDCHVASLFPNHPSIKDRSGFFIPVEKSPKAPKKRISASKALLGNSKSAILLFFGKSKAEALKNFQNPKLSVEQCPAKLIHAVKDSYLFTDLTIN